MAGGDDAQVELPALLKDVRPDVVGVERGVVQVYLETDLGVAVRLLDGAGILVGGAGRSG